MNKREMGTDQFVWWVGIIESRQDPIKVGRCQVRIFGKHTENKSDLPTDSLMWAHPLLPLNNANPYPPKEGDMVVGFFMDSTEGQYPIIFGLIPGIATMKAKSSEGFYDPRTADELNSAPSKLDEGKTNYPRVLGEPTTSRIARNESIEKTIIQKKKSDLAAADDWTEPTTPYAAKYPYDNVQESESGHVMEVDDTPNSERLHQYHRKGTFYEIGPDGTKVTKVVKDNYDITMGDDYALVEGKCNITIKGDAKITIHGNSTEIVKGDLDITTEGNSTVTTKGNTVELVEGNAEITVRGNTLETIEGDKKTIVLQDYEIQGNVYVRGNVTVSNTVTSIYIVANDIQTGTIEVADW